ncbi:MULTISPECIES: hypothetical protein [unclassified Bacillus (in: firmicutes)]|nr:MULTISPECIES: hypothetical protein [unclassified Bacillus (in: firmicutes)]
MGQTNKFALRMARIMESNNLMLLTINLEMAIKNLKENTAV